MAKQMSTLKHNGVVLETASQIEDHVVSYFENIFCSDNNCLDNGLIEEVIPHTVSRKDNVMLTSLPSAEEIRLAVFGLNNDGAPGPDGFGAFFF